MAPAAQGIFPLLATLPQLRVLLFSHRYSHPVSPADLRALQRLARLRRLELHYAYADDVADKDIAALLNGLSHSTSLSLHIDMPRLSSQVVGLIGKARPQLLRPELGTAADLATALSAVPKGHRPLFPCLRQLEIPNLVMAGLYLARYNQFFFSSTIALLSSFYRRGFSPAVTIVQLAAC